jgi:hypothetical protein
LPWQQIKRERAKRLAELPSWAAVKFHCAPENSCDYVCGSGRSVAWLARLPWAQEVASSNLAAPTISSVLLYCLNSSKGFFIYFPRNFFRLKKVAIILSHGQKEAGKSFQQFKQNNSTHKNPCKSGHLISCAPRFENWHCRC